MGDLPALSACKSNRGDLEAALATLLEPSAALSALCAELSNAPGALMDVSNHSELIDVAFAQIESWPDDRKADFISGHPRIGETKNLSALSSKEQASAATPLEVLERLRELNEEYERYFPGLRYITFVNGRTRAQIAEEMGAMLERDGVDLGSAVAASKEDWRRELERALGAVKAISLSRLAAVGAA